MALPWNTGCHWPRYVAFPRNENEPSNFPPAAFGVQFDSVHNDDHPLLKKYCNLMSVLANLLFGLSRDRVIPRSDVFGCPSPQLIFTTAASKYIPLWILERTADHGSNPRLKRAREAKKVVTEVAKEMVREKTETLLAGEGGRDIFSLLGRRC